MNKVRLVSGIVLLQLAVGGGLLGGPPEGGTGQMQLMDSSEKKMTVGTMRASQLIGVHVYDKQGVRIGQVTDLLMDKSQHHVGLARLDFQGIESLKDKTVILPVAMLKYSPSEDRIYVRADKALFTGAPNLNTRQWNFEANAGYFGKLDEYLKQNVQDMPEQARSSVQQFLDQAAEARPAAAQVAPAGEGTSANQKLTSYVGRSVQSPNGESIGKIDDVVIDTTTGNVLYAVLSYGGMIGMRDKLYAIPITAIQFQVGSDKLQLNTTKEQLKGMPSFDKEKWPATADPIWSKTN